MSNSRLLMFRAFLTERFTSMAVEVFEEIENMLAEFHEENSRLRDVLHMVLSPEIKLTHIDPSKYARECKDLRKRPQQITTEMDWETMEPLLKIPKEEEFECHISFEAEERWGDDSFVTPRYVKSEPGEQEESIMTDLLTIQAVETVVESHGAVSSEQSDATSSLDFDDVPANSPQEFSSEESERESNQIPNDLSKKKSKPRGYLQKTMVELPRMMLRTSATETTDYSSEWHADAYKDFPEDQKPLITKMGPRVDVMMVDSAFGRVPEGSVLSYQCPIPSNVDYRPCEDAPCQPHLPLSRYRLGPVLIPNEINRLEQEHVAIMQTTWQAAHKLEQSTRLESVSVEELCKLRLTSNFREVCKFKPGEDDARHLISKIQKGSSTGKNKPINQIDQSEVLWEYCRRLGFNWYPCGLVVHPNAPWLGALPDGLVYDPNEKPTFGLVHVKCIVLRSFADCNFLECQGGVMKLKTNHGCYWHIQGEMMVTGTSWCDLIISSTEDMLVQRIYRDKGVIEVMKKKLPDFFFRYYLKNVLH